jgi:hypothetical protein
MWQARVASPQLAGGRRVVLGAAAAGVLLAAPLPAQDVRAGQAEAITIGGFIGVSGFLQNRHLLPGNGQNGLYVAPDGTDRWWHGGDVRNSRLRVGLRGPALGEQWRGGGTLELDLFGGFPGTGAYVAEQPLLRLRLAYVEFARPGTALRLGQDWAPLLGQFPETVLHLGFPLGFGSAGVIGWRIPGLFLHQDLLTGDAAALRLRLAAMRGSWNDAPGPQLPTAGQHASIPQLEARLDAGSAAAAGLPWSAYLVGHYDRKDLEAAGRGTGRVDGWAAQLGGRVQPGPLTLQGNAWVGRAVGQSIAHILQFGDIGGRGAWAQAGVALSPRWSVWSFAGFDDPDDPDDADLGAGARLHNRTLDQMLRFRDGPYQIGLEWLRMRTVYGRALLPGEALREEPRVGHKIALSVRFDF